MRTWSVPSSTEIALSINAAVKRPKQTAKFVYLGGGVSADANISIDISGCISAAWARLREYSSQLYDRPNT